MMRWALFLVSVLAFADTLTLKNGRVISGSYLGGTTTAIQFAVGDQVQTIPITDIDRLTFGNAFSAAAPPSSGGAPLRLRLRYSRPPMSPTSSSGCVK